MTINQMLEKEPQTRTELKEQKPPVQKSEMKYGLFSEQYLEKPVISGDYAMALSPTACTIKGIPVIDDF